MIKEFKKSYRLFPLNTFYVCLCVCVHFIQMALREQETAVAVQDMEVRQMELDAQRRLFEQVSP